MNSSSPPDEFLIPSIGRTRDVPCDEITQKILDELDARGRPTLLFSPDGRSPQTFPVPVQDYLESGERMGIHLSPLISTRNPWYKMETRSAPPLLFAYLGRRNARFIRNHASVIPLTCLLCVYPHSQDAEYIDKLWSVIRHEKTLANLPLVGKSYGSGAIKVEPRALEKLRLPESVLATADLYSPHKAAQMQIAL